MLTNLQRWAPKIIAAHEPHEQHTERVKLGHALEALRCWTSNLSASGSDRPPDRSTVAHFQYSSERVFDCLRFSNMVRGGSDRLVEVMAQAVMIALPVPLRDAYAQKDYLASAVPCPSTLRHSELALDAAMILLHRENVKDDFHCRYMWADSSSMAGHDWFWMQYTQIKTDRLVPVLEAVRKVQDVVHDVLQDLDNSDEADDDDVLTTLKNIPAGLQEPLNIIKKHIEDYIFPPSALISDFSGLEDKIKTMIFQWAIGVPDRIPLKSFAASFASNTSDIGTELSMADLCFGPHGRHEAMLPPWMDRSPLAVDVDNAAEGERAGDTDGEDDAPDGPDPPVDYDDIPSLCSGDPLDFDLGPELSDSDDDDAVERPHHADGAAPPEQLDNDQQRGAAGGAAPPCAAAAAGAVGGAAVGAPQHAADAAADMEAVGANDGAAPAAVGDNEAVGANDVAAPAAANAAADMEYCMPNCLTVAGLQHIVDNLTADVHSSMPMWSDFYGKLKQFEALLRADDRRQHFVWTCLKGTSLERFRRKFRRFRHSLYESRWREVVGFLKRLVPLLPILYEAWDQRKFDVHAKTGDKRRKRPRADMDEPKKMHAFDASIISGCLRDSYFGSACRMMLAIEEVPTRLASWAEACPCHGDAFAKLSPYHCREVLLCHYGEGFASCPVSGMRAPELATGKLDEVAEEVFAQTAGTMRVMEAMPGCAPLSNEQREDLMKNFWHGKNGGHDTLEVEDSFLVAVALDLLRSFCQ